MATALHRQSRTEHARRDQVLGQAPCALQLPGFAGAVWGADALNRAESVAHLLDQGARA
jgi:hypothetical protein